LPRLVLRNGCAMCQLWQADGKGCPNSGGALHPDESAALLDDAIHRREAESGAHRQRAAGLIDQLGPCGPEWLLLYSHSPASPAGRAAPVEVDIYPRWQWSHLKMGLAGDDA
jgi:hypothetical protein